MIKTTRLRSGHMRLAFSLLLALALYGSVGWAALGWTAAAGSPPQWGSPLIGALPRVVPKPILFDAKVLLWGAEHHARGQDPLDDVFWGEDDIVYNYPPGWIWLSWLRLDRTDLPLVAWCFFAGLAATFLFFLPPTTLGAVSLHAAVLFSPPFLNAVGQANGELVVIALVLASASLAAHPGSFARTIAVTCLACAAILKLYPAIGFAALLRRGRRVVPALMGGGLVLLVFFGMRGQIAMVIHRTPHPAHTAFGCQVLAERASLALNAHRSEVGRHPLANVALGALAQSAPALRAAAMLIAAAACLLGFRRGPTLPGGAAPDPGLAFGCLLFLGAFLIGASWSHRLLSLLPCLGAAWRTRRPAFAAFLVAVLWSTALDFRWLFVAGQALTWCALAVLAFELGRLLATMIAIEGSIVRWRRSAPDSASG